MDSHILAAETEFKKILEHLKGEFTRMQIGRASAALVEHLMVEAYGSKQPLKAVASISVPDAKSIQIQPWDKSQLQAIEKAILTSDLHLTPMNDGISVRLNLPPLTEERRRDLAKVVNKLAEEARITVRHIRQKFHDQARELEKSKQITEDQAKGFAHKLQEKVDKTNQEIESMSSNKERDVMTV